MKKNLFITTLCILISFAVTAQTAGSLDSTFNSNGIYTYDFGFHDNLNDVTVQPDGKIVCTGVALNAGFAGVLKVMRLNIDGTPDNTFGINSVFSILIGNETYGYESFVQPDGKIIVAGITYDANYYADWLLLCLDSTGVLDSSFGTNGITMVDFFTRDDFAQAITFQADGKIVVAGTITDTINYFNNPSIVRFTENGIIDSTFGVNGVVTIPAIDIDNELTSIAVQADGKILAAGHYSKVFTGAMDFDILVIRVDTNGVPDATFGNNGVVKTSINGGIDDSFGMELDSAQNIIVAGFTTLPFTLTLDMVLLKYDSTGTLDPNFGTAGIVTFNNADEDVAYDVKIQPDNKIVVGGSSGLSFFGPRSLAVWRYLPDGTPDNTFGTNGFVTTAINPDFQDLNGIALQPDGKIVGAGRTYNGSQNDIAVVRYLNDVSTSVVEAINKNAFTVFPNPVSQNGWITLNYELKNERHTQIEFYNLTGSKIAFIQPEVSLQGNHTIEIRVPARLVPGIYFVKVTGEEAVSSTFKLVVSK